MSSTGTCCIPDPQMAWVLPASIKSLYIIRKAGRIAHLHKLSTQLRAGLGLILKRVTNLPWVADFRDPWTEGIRRQQAYQRNSGRQRIEDALERAVIARADHVVVTTEKTWSSSLANTRRFADEKFSVITNGFDPADFALHRCGHPAAEPTGVQRHPHRQRRGHVRCAAVLPRRAGARR